MGHGSPKELVNGSLKELVKVYANVELEKWQRCPRRANEPRMPKRK